MQKESVKFQYFAAFVANLLTISFGIMEGWTSPNILLLMSDATPLASGKITMHEASWIAALPCAGSLFGNIIFGYITNNFGRKMPLVFIIFPTIVGWLLVWFAQNVYYIYASRLVIGFFGGGGYMIVPLFLSEIANDRIRGSVVSTLVFFENCGTLIGFVFGHFFNFYAIPKLVIALSILFGILLTFFPETPLFLLKQNKELEAQKSIKFYQSLGESSENQKQLELELIKLKSTLDAVKSDKSHSRKQSFLWSDLTTKIARKAIIIGIVLVSVNQFSGVVAIMSYTATIFEEAGSNISPNIATIVVGVIQVIGSCVATSLVDRTGRKLLFVVSTFGTALGLITLGVYMMMKSWNYNVDAFNWIPVTSLSFSIFTATLAVLSLPLLVIPEVLPENIKDFCMSFCMSLLWIFSFITIKYLPLLTELLGFHGSMYLFAGVCLSSGLFIILCVPETKGKSHEQIMNSLQ